MASKQVKAEQRLFQYGVGAVRTVLIHSPHVVFYHLERLNENGEWTGILERYFTSEQFADFLRSMEPEISRTLHGRDRIRDSIHVSVSLASDDIQEDRETSPEDNGER